MSKNGHEARSCSERARAADAAGRPRAAGPVRACQRRPRRGAQQSSLPLLLHLSAPPSRAIPDLKIRPVRTTYQRDGHRQYLRISRSITIFRRRVGEKYTLLPRPPSHRPSGALKARLVGTVRPKRVPMFHAPPCGSAPGGCRSTRFTDGRGPGGRLYGPHKDLPRASGEAESPPRRLGGVFLSEGHRPLHDRCLWPIRRAPHREPSREIPVRPRRILQESIPEPAHALREAAPPAALTPHRQLPSHRAVILREISRENSNRDANKGHAAVRELVLMALHGDHVTHDVATVGGGMIHALRLPAVLAQSALRLPKVPA